MTTDVEYEYELHIDTDLYAGNFSRELTAYCTGVTGECEVGEEEANEYYHELELHSGPDRDEYNPLARIITRKPDDHGCYRPCDVTATPGLYGTDYTSGKLSKQAAPSTEFPHRHIGTVVILFSARPDTSQITQMVSRATRYGCRPTPAGRSLVKNFKVLGWRLVEKETTTRVVDTGSC